MSPRATPGTPRSAAGRILAAAAAAALVASLGLADETRGGADPSARVRFDHRRHDAWTGDCATCHSSGPSPHGGDFESRCGSLAAESPGVCLQCHATVPDCR